jgi:hypothetical protein
MQSLDQQSHSEICEAADCFAIATKILEVKVGILGQISLSLCKSCVLKFEDKENVNNESRKVKGEKVLEEVGQPESNINPPRAIFSDQCGGRK